MYFDDLEILRTIERCERDGQTAGLSSGEWLLKEVLGSAHPVYDDNACRSFIRELESARRRDLVDFTVLGWGGTEPNIDQMGANNYLAQMRDFRLSPFGRDRARCRVLEREPPDPHEDDGKPITRLTFERITAILAAAYEEPHLRFFLLDGGVAEEMIPPLGEDGRRLAGVFSRFNAGARGGGRRRGCGRVGVKVVCRCLAGEASCVPLPARRRSGFNRRARAAARDRPRPSSPSRESRISGVPPSSRVRPLRLHQLPGSDRSYSNSLRAPGAAGPSRACSGSNGAGESPATMRGEKALASGRQSLDDDAHPTRHLASLIQPVSDRVAFLVRHSVEPIDVRGDLLDRLLWAAIGAIHQALDRAPGVRVVSLADDRESPIHDLVGVRL